VGGSQPTYWAEYQNFVAASPLPRGRSKPFVGALGVHGCCAFPCRLQAGSMDSGHRLALRGYFPLMSMAEACLRHSDGPCFVQVSLVRSDLDLCLCVLRCSVCACSGIFWVIPWCMSVGRECAEVPGSRGRGRTIMCCVEEGDVRCARYLKAGRASGSRVGPALGKLDLEGV
jgi:hypothetical protein